MNTTTSKTLRYASIAAIVAILGALTFWYFFIQAKQEKVAREDAGRGTNIESPSLGSIVGSTYENIVSSLSTLVGGGSASTTEKLQRLSQVGKTPTAGFGFIGNGASSRLRFVERSTGYIFDVDPKTGALERLTNTLIPYVYEALVTNKGVVLRGSDESEVITTTVGTVSTSSSASSNTRALVQKSLPKGIYAISTDTSGENMVYLTGGEGNFTAVKSAWDGTKPKALFSAALAQWRLYTSSKDRVIVVQKPSDTAEGNSYVVGGDGTLIPLIRRVQGLTLLPHPSSKALIYGESGRGLSLFAMVDASSTSARLPIRTVADKCAWGPGPRLVAYCAVPQGIPPANFLDSWNRGEIHTADAWWKVDVGAASAELLYSPGNTELDVASPAVDDSGNYIAFINTRDMSLWLLRIKE